MTEQPSRRIIDLTKPIDSALSIYREGEYSDPEFRCSEWSTIEREGYRVSSLALGTQTGTHIDAPSHFDMRGAGLEALPPEHLCGTYALFDLPERLSAEAARDLCRRYAGEQLLFFRAPRSGRSNASSDALAALIALAPPVWVLAGAIKIEGGEKHLFHSALARAGKYLVEDLASTAYDVEPGHELFALPLALVGTSGAPCRVFVREMLPVWS